MPNFIEIGQTSLEIGGGVNMLIGPRTKQINLLCHVQTRDYSSRDSQCARGATKMEEKNKQLYNEINETNYRSVS